MTKIEFNSTNPILVIIEASQALLLEHFDQTNSYDNLVLKDSIDEFIPSSNEIKVHKNDGSLVQVTGEY